VRVALEDENKSLILKLNTKQVYINKLKGELNAIRSHTVKKIETIEGTVDRYVKAMNQMRTKAQAYDQLLKDKMIL